MVQMDTDAVFPARRPSMRIIGSRGAVSDGPRKARPGVRSCAITRALRVRVCDVSAWWWRDGRYGE